MLAVSVHYYEPPTFCVADTTSTWDIGKHGALPQT